MHRWWRTTGLVVAMVVVAGMFYVIGSAITAARQSAARNRQAISVSCTLLANAVIQASQGNHATGLFVTAIKRVMTPHEQRLLDNALRHRPATGVQIPSCKRIVAHPETVHPLALGHP